MTTTTRAIDMIRGVVYRATPESVEACLNTRSADMRTAMVRTDVNGVRYVLTIKYNDTEIIALMPPRTPTAWALVSNFAGQPIVTAFPEWRGWGLTGGSSIEVIDQRGEIEEFKTRVHAAVTKEGRDRGWCSEADTWLTRLGLPPRGTNATVTITGTRRMPQGGTAEGMQRDLERVLVNASITGLTVTVAVADVPDVPF